MVIKLNRPNFNQITAIFLILFCFVLQLNYLLNESDFWIVLFDTIILGCFVLVAVFRQIFIFEYSLDIPEKEFNKRIESLSKLKRIKPNDLSIKNNRLQFRIDSDCLSAYREVNLKWKANRCYILICTFSYFDVISPIHIVRDLIEAKKIVSFFENNILLTQ